MSLTQNPTKLPLEELLKLEQQIQGEIAKQREAKRAEVLKDIADLVRQYGLTFDEVVRAIRSTAKRGKATALYRNPTNPRQTWSGKGVAPDWYNAAPNKDALRIV